MRKAAAEYAEVAYPASTVPPRENDETRAEIFSVRVICAARNRKVIKPIKRLNPGMEERFSGEEEAKGASGKIRQTISVKAIQRNYTR